MKITDEIFLDGNLIKGSTLKVTYKGKFAKEHSNQVVIIYGYGLGLKNIQEKEMTWTGESFVAEIDLVESGELNFSFKNDLGNWDNNNGNDYTVSVASNESSEGEKKDRYRRYHIPEKNTETTKKIKDNEESLYEYVNNSKQYEDKYFNINDIANKDKTSKDSNTTKNVDENAKKTKKKTSKLKKFIRLICLIALCACIVYYIINYFKIKDVQKESQSLLSNKTDKTVLENSEADERILEVKELNSQYPDLKAWIEIEDTTINYPIMQGEDNNYYVKHDYKKEYSKWGALFLDKDFDWDKPSSNLLIYGHNFSDGLMFADLLKYRNEEFYNNHKTIRFTTTEEDAEYEILSVFNSRVYYKSETNVFRYYFFVDAENEEEYDEYVKNAKKASIYDTGVDAKYGDQLLTLSTCDYSQEDGRFVVVAKKIEK